MLGQDVGEKILWKKVFPIPLSKKLLIYDKIYGAVSRSPKLAQSARELSRPKGISRETCEHIALLYIAFARGKHIAPSYARHFFPQARERAFGSQWIAYRHEMRQVAWIGYHHELHLRCMKYIRQFNSCQRADNSWCNTSIHDTQVSIHYNSHDCFS